VILNYTSLLIDFLLFVVVIYTSLWWMSYAKWFLIIRLCDWYFTLSDGNYTSFWLMPYTKWFLILHLFNSCLTLSDSWLYGFVINILRYMILNYTPLWLMSYPRCYKLYGLVIFVLRSIIFNLYACINKNIHSTLLLMSYAKLLLILRLYVWCLTLGDP